MKPSSRSLYDLVPEFRDKAKAVIDACKQLHGVDLLVTCTYRSLEDQMSLYASGRSKEDIVLKANSGSLPPEIVALLRVYAMTMEEDTTIGRKKTNAAPGESWHNYGEAMDVVPLKDGKPIWDISDPAWKIYGRECELYHLNWAGNWRYFAEYPHCQLSEFGNPLKVMPYIDSIIRLKDLGALPEQL